MTNGGDTVSITTTVSPTVKDEVPGSPRRIPMLGTVVPTVEGDGDKDRRILVLRLSAVPTGCFPISEQPVESAVTRTGDGVWATKDVSFAPSRAPLPGAFTLAPFGAGA